MNNSVVDYRMIRALNLLKELLADGVNLGDSLYEAAIKNDILEDDLLNHAIDEGVIQ